MPTGRKARTLALAALVLFASGCAKRIHFDALPLAGSGSANVRIDLTFDRNNSLEVKLSNVPEPSALNSQFTRYVLWAATPDHSHVINLGQIRVENKKADMKTLTPLRRFVLFITAEAAGDVMTPGTEILFQTKEVAW